MRTQEQALRIYYAAMPDADLQSAAANRSSFLPLAQRLLTEELRKRHLEEAPAAATGVPEHHGVMNVLRHAFRH